MSQGDDWQAHLRSSTRTGTLTRQALDGVEVFLCTLLAHPVSHRVGEWVQLDELDDGRPLALSRLEPLFVPDAEGVRRPLADPHLSRQGVVLRGSGDGGVVVDAAATPMVVTVDGEKVEDRLALGGDALRRGVVLTLAHRVVLLLRRASGVPLFSGDARLIGDSAAMARVRDRIRAVADLPHCVLLRGESGTGKELVARAVHDAGPRREGPFVAVNVGALSPSLAAAELFGAEKGAYSGADRRRRGLFRRADGGTLFLDEIGEAAPEVQVLLLRVLETGQVEPLGAEKTETVDVRVVSATDSDLESAVAAGRFRAPLLHRLTACVVELPPLRERREDFGRLFVHFLREELAAVGEAARLEKADGGLDTLPDIVGRLALCTWPGNVRQLRNVVRQLVISARGGAPPRLDATVERLLDTAPPSGEPPSEEPPSGEPPSGEPASRYRDPSEVGDGELREALHEAGWNVQRAAARLGVARTTLYKLIDRCPTIRKASEMSRGEIEACRERCAGNLAAMAAALEVSPRGLQIRMKALGLS